MPARNELIQTREKRVSTICRLKTIFSAKDVNISRVLFVIQVIILIMLILGHQVTLS